jgi:hypothetical protein
MEAKAAKPKVGFMELSVSSRAGGHRLLTLQTRRRGTKSGLECKAYGYPTNETCVPRMASAAARCTEPLALTSGSLATSRTQRIVSVPDNATLSDRYC